MSMNNNRCLWMERPHYWQQRKTGNTGSFTSVQFFPSLSAVSQLKEKKIPFTFRGQTAPKVARTTFNRRNPGSRTLSEHFGSKFHWWKHQFSTRFSDCKSDSIRKRTTTIRDNNNGRASEQSYVHTTRTKQAAWANQPTRREHQSPLSMKITPPSRPIHNFPPSVSSKNGCRGSAQ